MRDSCVIYGDSPIQFSVSYRNHLSDKVAIHVQPDGRVLVDAPHGSKAPGIKAAVLKRARWILKQLKQQQALQRHTAPRQYISGETHWYLGRRYLLKVRPSDHSEATTKLARGRLTVSLPAIAPAAVEAALDEWYRERAIAIFQQRLEAIASELSWVKQLPPWQLRPMKKQWGSCSPKGRISLNPMLIKAPRQCIDYVILHELCHLKHHNHSDKFFRLLKRTMPNWEATKQKLDNMAELILF